MIILAKLLLAHFLGDFVLQPNSWVKEKEANKGISVKFCLHILIHILLTAIILYNIQLWYMPIIIGITHFFIDWGKISLQKKKHKRLYFFTDQLLHIIVIFLLYYFHATPSLDFFRTDILWIFILCLVFLTQPVSIIIKTLISYYTPKTEIEKDESLTNAGKYIGILERLLVFIFIVTQHWEGVGFLIAAKSIFRFGDLTEAKDRKLTEYILIGTLLSFGIAIAVGLIFSWSITIL
ncbi:DUF3307 domain-containing protein [Zhouia sp. PK063]|uniref:DUF3307 domain-containing protein n=1 Tax=Zhouia sp. PK063 TaxID=3373602 RepID=UPI0037A62A3B